MNLFQRSRKHPKADNDTQPPNQNTSYEALKEIFVYEDENDANRLKPAAGPTATPSASEGTGGAGIALNPDSQSSSQADLARLSSQPASYVERLRSQGGWPESPAIDRPQEGQLSPPVSSQPIPSLPPASPQVQVLPSLALPRTKGVPSLQAPVSYLLTATRQPTVTTPTPTLQRGITMGSNAVNGINGNQSAGPATNGYGNEGVPQGYALTPQATEYPMASGAMVNSVALATQRELRKERERMQAISKQIREGTHLEEVLQAAIGQSRELLRVDRVLVYRFTNDGQGRVVAESMGPGWTPMHNEYLPALFFGAAQVADYSEGGVFTFGRNQYADLSPYHLQLLDKFQVNASCAVPIFLNQTVWGLFVVHQCNQSRYWEEADVDLVERIVTELRLKLQGIDFQSELQKYLDQEEALVKVIQKIQESADIDTIFRTTTNELRKALGADRAVVYRFNEDWSGEVIAESVGAGWNSILRAQEQDASLKGDILDSEKTLIHQFGGGHQITFEIEDTLLRKTKGGSFNRGIRYLKVDDVEAMNYSECYLETLAKFQCKAYINVPIFHDKKLWGILGVYQNSGPRKWEMAEVNLMANLTTPMSTALQQSLALQQLQTQAQQLADRAKRDSLVIETVNRIRQTFDIERIFKTSTQEVRRLLKCDRVVIYRFNEDWSGEFVAESVADGWDSLLRRQREEGFSVGQDAIADRQCTIIDTYLKDTQGGSYVKGEKFKKVDDIYAQNFPSCYVETLEMFQCKAYINVPVYQGSKLWGLMSVYQNSGPRHWVDEDVNLLLQISPQLSLALQQADYVGQMEQQAKQLQEAAERERLVTDLVNRIRQTTKTDWVFRTATQEIRRLLSCDRVVVYRFNEDWSGEVVAESVAGGWMPLLQLQAEDDTIRTELMASDRCVVKYYGDSNSTIFEQDTYLKDTKGGQYTKGVRFRCVNDIQAMNFPTCYLQTLEKFQCKAYINAPIFQGANLWGLLVAYQNDAPRIWQDTDINLLLQVAPQIGLALQQSEYLGQLESQSQQLQAIVDREKAAKEQLQQQVVQLLRAVRPALQGDLTVRAPITEDEVGTVADAYNNTLQSLRQLVQQVKVAATKVGETSQDSSRSIAKLSTQAQQEVDALRKAMAELDSMSNVTQAVTTNAAQVEVAVQQANQVVQRGDQAMNRTVDGIQAIRSTVSETSKKIKRLSESSQKISRVVSLIGDFTTQTQLLALNAAIEATRAGEYGRGFAVVADEVRSLARQSAEATTEIEKLVQEIQSETGAVTQAMDTGIEQVVSGTNLVNETRQSLNEIVAATAQISELVKTITQAAQAQSQQVGSVTATMGEVTAIATQTSTDSLSISESFQMLLATAEQLQTSVGKFKVS